MRHGRDHEERENKIRLTRTNNTPEADAFEVEMLQAGRTGATPPQQVIGAHETRSASSGSEEEGAEPTGPGSDVAPTKRAEEREKERHRLERELGRTPAAEGGHIRDRRSAEVTREQLDEAGRKADEKVAGHRIEHRPGKS